MDYRSTLTFDSGAVPGVRITLRRMSFGGRMDLARSLQKALEQMDAALVRPPGELRDAELAMLAAEANAAYLRWGLVELDGLEIDGVPAAPDTLLAGGPEALVLEIVERIKAEAGLSEEERKNSGSPSTSCAVGRQDRASGGSATPAGASASTANAIAAASTRSFSAAIPPSPSGCGGPPTTGERSIPAMPSC